MGWDFTKGASKKDVIAELSKRSVKSCVRGNVHVIRLSVQAANCLINHKGSPRQTREDM